MYNRTQLTRNMASVTLQSATEGQEAKPELRRRKGTCCAQTQAGRQEDYMRNYRLARALARGAVVSAVAVSMMGTSVLGQSVDLSKWSPEYVRSIAGTEEFDTAEACGA